MIKNDRDLEFIKDYSKINISKICRDLKIDRSNLLSGRVKKEKIVLVKDEILNRTFKLFLKEEQKNEERAN